jgi:Mce-associated membrane protein
VVGAPAAIEDSTAVDAPVGERRGRGPVLGWIVLGLLVVLLAFELVQLIGSDRGLPKASGADTSLVRNFAVAVTSFDYKRLDADVQRVLDMGTSGFERDFRSAMGPNFTDRIAANKSVSSGDIVVGPRLQRLSGGRATFFVVVDQTVTSEGSQSQPQLVHTGLLVTVQEKDHKVASVQVL